MTDHYYLVRFELLNDVRRVRRYDGLPHFPLHEPRYSALSVWRERDLGLFHREDDGLSLLQVSNHREQCEDQEVAE